ncbi:MAG: lysophospholipid acyltransferase family protein [Candidatus Limnocylindrales bacterium]
MVAQRAISRGEPLHEATLDRVIGGVDSALSPDRDATPELRALPASRHRRSVDPVAAARNLPRGDVSARQRSIRHWFGWMIAVVPMRLWFRIEVVGAERLGNGPAVYCFNHLSWMDPLVLTAVFPKQPRLYFYGPKEPDLRRGGRNRFMWWFGICVPFSPLKDDLLTSVRWVQAVFDTGGALAISGEGTIHVHEGDLMPFHEGAAYMALRGGVPLVPVAITGTSWARFRGRVQVRIGEPIPTGERPTRHALANLTARVWHAIRAMVDGDRDLTPPSRVGRWFTDMFNDWGPGGRAAAAQRRGPDPADVPIPENREG